MKTKTLCVVSCCFMLSAMLSACGSMSSDPYLESLAPARLRALQNTLAVIQEDLNTDRHPNPMSDDAYFAVVEPHVQAMHAAAKQVRDIQVDVKQQTGYAAPKYSTLDSDFAKIGTLADQLVDYFEHPKTLPECKNNPGSIAGGIGQSRRKIPGAGWTRICHRHGFRERKIIKARIAKRNHQKRGRMKTRPLYG
jgi:hypothetical protein